jgi:hypothetical protein
VKPGGNAAAWIVSKSRISLALNPGYDCGKYMALVAMLC